MTKKFHVCDEGCEPAGTGIHTTEDAKKKRLPSGTKVKSTKKSAKKALKKQKVKIENTKKFKEKYVETEFGKVNVYVSESFNINHKIIDDLIEEIKEESKKISKDEYSTNNVNLILQDALKKIKLANN